MTAMADVEALWGAVVAGDPSVNTFEFREKILKVAKRSFGMLIFGDWISAQKATTAYCDYHQRWIDETVHFVLFDKRRECTYNVWVGLLYAPSSAATKALVAN